jgi:hypothetical protein
MKYIYLILLSLISSIGFSQTNGITYQAVILNPVEGELPGVNHTNAPLANTAICLKFGIIDQNTLVEYSETIQTTTDKFGMVNLIIGTGSKIAGYANTFSDVAWSTDAKNLQVHLSTAGNCSSYIEISNQPFTYVPFALNALNAQKQVKTLDSIVSSNIANISAVQANVDANEATANTAIATVQADVDANEAAANTAIAAVQSDVDANEATANAAIATVQADVDANEATANAAIATVQADVDANEVASNAGDSTNLANTTAAIAVVQSDVDANEATANAAIATVQSDVDANEATANAAIATVQSDVDANEATANTAIATVQADVDANEVASNAGDSTNLANTTAAIAVVQADVDANEAAANAAIATVQSDVDANEATANAAVATVQSDVDANEATANTAIATVQSDVDANEAAANAAIATVQADVDANATSITTNASNITTNTTAVASNASGITTNASGIANNASNITTLETLADGKIYLGNASDVATEVTMSGDVTIDNAGATTVGTLNNLTVTNPIVGSVTGTSANVTGVVAITTGGTGSSTQNFVDLTTDQTVAGAKTFSNEMAVIGNVTASGTITAGAITIPNTDGTDGQVLVTDGSGTLTWQTTSITEADSAVIADFGFVANRTDMVIGKLVDYQTTIASVGRLQIRYSSNATGGYLEARTLSGSINSMVYSTRKQYNWNLAGNTSVTNFHSNSGQYPTAWTPLIPLWNASASAWSDNVTISTYQTLEGTIHHMGSGSVAPNPEFYSFWATLDGYNQITIRLEYTD